MAYQVPRYKQQAPITKMLHALFTQGLPQYASYKMQQKAEKEKQKQADKEFKQKETQMKLDFLTAMTKDRNPMVAGQAVAGLEELLGTAPYSAVMGQEKLRPRGMPQRGMQQPGRMQMGPQAGGVMTTRQPSMGEMVSGAEPEAGMTPYQTGQLGLGRERFTLQQQKDQRATDMNLINNYYATDEQGNFTTPYENVKMIEAQVKEAAMRQFGNFRPRLPGEKKAGFLGINALRKDVPERLGAPQTKPQTGRIKVQSPDGATGTIPANQLEEALRNGYKRVR